MKSTPPEIVGRAHVMVQLLSDLGRFSPADVRVLITGESGVGKELVAGYIHAHSSRAARSFVAVNCAGMPETLLESELFGHVKGSFTGAYRDKRGRFEMAHGGTLFLDEVGDMSLRMQGLLLRVLEGGEVERVGSDRTTARVDVRVIAATNRDLPVLIQKGLFREDLFYRLNVIHVHVPPLRERVEDIPVLAQLFLDRVRSNGAHTYTLTPDFLEAVKEYRWPGNVRQLDNTIQRLALNSRTGVISAADLPADLQVTTSRLPEPSHERRRVVADALYEQIGGGSSFWDVAYRPYMSRQITGDDVRALVQMGLEASGGNYRVVTRQFNIPAGEYRRFLNFLRKHHCLLPYREYR